MMHPLLGWEGQDWNLGIIDRLRADDFIYKTFFFRANMDLGDSEILAYPQDACITLSVESVKEKRLTMERWDCYQRIAEHILAATAWDDNAELSAL